jgi:hypothetical protein
MGLYIWKSELLGKQPSLFFPNEREYFFNIDTKTQSYSFLKP